MEDDLTVGQLLAFQIFIALCQSTDVTYNSARQAAINSVAAAKIILEGKDEPETA